MAGGDKLAGVIGNVMRVESVRVVCVECGVKGMLRSSSIGDGRGSGSGVSGGVGLLGVDGGVALLDGGVTVLEVKVAGGVGSGAV